MAQIVPDVTVVSEIVNIAVAFRSSVWPLQTEFVSLSMNFYQDGRACVMVGQDGVVHCGHGR